ncbi:GNAT family N-acetyltransferase [Candidatus Dependentiae bacterium]
MQSMRKSYFFRFVVLATIFSATIAGLVYYFSVEKLPIYDFEYTRDSKPILKMFDKDWYWLVSSSREEYSPDFTLRYKTPDRNPRNFGKLIIKVLREDNKFAGFTAYYKETFFKGILLYVGVDREFRGKGYGRKLTDYAVKDLFSRGCTIVWLVTRTDNTKARNLYKKLGFTETKIYDGFVDYEIRKK